MGETTRSKNMEELWKSHNRLGEDVHSCMQEVHGCNLKIDSVNDKMESFRTSMSANQSSIASLKTQMDALSSMLQNWMRMSDNLTEAISQTPVVQVQQAGIRPPIYEGLLPLRVEQPEVSVEQIGACKVIDKMSQSILGEVREEMTTGRSVFGQNGSKNEAIKMFEVMSKPVSIEKPTPLSMEQPQNLRDADPYSSVLTYNSVEAGPEVKNLLDYERESTAKQVLGGQNDAYKVIDGMTISAPTGLHLCPLNYIKQEECSFNGDEVIYLLSNSPSFKPGNLLIDGDFQLTALRIESVEVTHHHLLDEMSEPFPTDVVKEQVLESYNLDFSFNEPTLFDPGGGANSLRHADKRIVQPITSQAEHQGSVSFEVAEEGAIQQRLGIPAEAGNQLPDKVRQLHSLKPEGLEDTRHLFDKMPKRISAELNEEMYAVQDYTSQVGYVLQIFDTLVGDEVILSFDPGGGTCVFYKGRDPFKCTSADHEFDKFQGISFASDLAIQNLLGITKGYHYNPIPLSVGQKFCLWFGEHNGSSMGFQCVKIEGMAVLSLIVTEKTIWPTVEQLFGTSHGWSFFNNIVGSIEMICILDAVSYGPVLACKCENSTMMGIGVSRRVIEPNSIAYTCMPKWVDQACCWRLFGNFLVRFGVHKAYYVLFVWESIKSIMYAKLLISSMAGILGLLGIVFLAEAIEYCSCAVCVPENDAHRNVVYALNINFGSSLASIASSQMDCEAEFFFTMPTFNFPAIGKVVSGMNGLIWSFNTIAHDEEVAKQCSWGYVHHLGEGYLVKSIIISELDGFIHVWQDKMFASVNYITDCFSIGSVLDLNEVPAKVARVFAKPSMILLKAMLEVSFAFKRRETLFYISCFGYKRYLKLSLEDLQVACEQITWSKFVLFSFDPGECGNFVHRLIKGIVFLTIRVRIGVSFSFTSLRARMFLRGRKRHWKLRS